MLAAGQVPDDGSGDVRVLHWNIHSWRDESGAPSTGAVTELISRTSPHAVSLVEVDETWNASMRLSPTTAPNPPNPGQPSWPGSHSPAPPCGSAAPTCRAATTTTGERRRASS